MKAAFCPLEPRRFPGGRAVQVVFRTLHIVSMGMVLGGIAMGGTHDTLWNWILATVVSGLVLLGIDVYKSCSFLLQGAGMAVLLKLVLLGFGNLYPEVRLEWYLAATVVASIGSHMSSAWRHFSFLRAEEPGPE